MAVLRKFLFSFFIFTAVFLFFVFPTISLAAMSFTVDEIVGNPKELPVGEELKVKVSFSGVSGEKQYYLFLAFRKPESGAYNFGFTQNNDGDWIKYGDSFDNFYKIEIKESSWSGILKVRSDYEAKGFKDEGEYQIRAGRYVSSDNASWTENQDLRIVLKAPTLTPTPTLILTPTPEPINNPTPTPKPPTSTPTPKQTVTPSLTPKPTSKTASESGEVLGEEVATLSAFYPYEATEGAGENEATSSAKNKLWPKVFLVVGLLLVFASAFWGWYNLKDYTS